MAQIEISMKDIVSKEQRLLAEIVGIQNYIRLIDEFGGMSVYIPKKDYLIRKIRDREICKRFDGGNYRQLAQEFDLSESAVRSIVSDGLEMQGQISFFETENEK